MLQVRSASRGCTRRRIRAGERAGTGREGGREGKGGRSERREAERRGRRGTEASEYVCRCELVYTVYVPAAVSLRECRLELVGRSREGRRPAGQIAPRVSAALAPTLFWRLYTHQAASKVTHSKFNSAAALVHAMQATFPTFSSCEFRADSHFPLSGSPTKRCTDDVLITVQQQWLYTYLRNTVTAPPTRPEIQSHMCCSSEPVASTTISRRPCPEPRPTAAWRLLAAVGVVSINLTTRTEHKKRRRLLLQ